MQETIDDKNLTVLVPAYNEEQSIGSVVKRIYELNSDIVKEIIVIDDGSTDSTAEIAEKAGALVVRHKKNKGYGAAIKTGISQAKTEYMLAFDGDGQYFEEDIRKMWEIADDNDMVSGLRTRLIHSPLWRMPGKWILKYFASFLVQQKIPDLNSGLRLFRKSVIVKYLHICPSGFSFTTTSMMAFLYRGYNVGFVPVDVKEREGKSTVSIFTGMETIILIIRMSALFNPIRLFIPASIFSIIFGILWGLPYMVTHRGLSIAAMLAIVTGIILFAIGIICDQVSQLRLERFE